MQLCYNTSIRLQKKMNISEPSLSRSIAALEDELGVTLFEKEAET